MPSVAEPAPRRRGKNTVVPPPGPKSDPSTAAKVFQIEFRPLAKLTPYARNARMHSSQQVAQIAGAMQEWGFTNPILADATGIVAGHGRAAAARQLFDAGQTIKLPSGALLPKDHVPVIDCTGWNDAQRKAYIIADNQLALGASWDNDLLRIELKDLEVQAYDLNLIGFSDAELNLLANGWNPDKDMVDRQAESSDPLKGMVKVLCNKEDTDEVRELVKQALEGFEGATVSE